MLAKTIIAAAMPALALAGSIPHRVAPNKVVAARQTATSASATASATPSWWPQPVLQQTNTNCVNFYKVLSGDDCTKVSSLYHITVAEVEAWNPLIGSNCEYLPATWYVCVGLPGDPPNGAVWPTSATTASPTSTSPAATPTNWPSPTVGGVTPDCTKFYEIQSGDVCWSIEQSQGITDDQLHAWNTGVDVYCSNLYPGQYMCVSVS